MFAKDALCYKNNSIICSLSYNLSLLRKIIDEAKEIGNDNAFPDFAFEGGIIEHFIVSPSKENKKGSYCKIKI